MNNNEIFDHKEDIKKKVIRIEEKVIENKKKRKMIIAALGTLFTGTAITAAALIICDKDLRNEKIRLLAENEGLKKSLTIKDAIIKDNEKKIKILTPHALRARCSLAGKIMNSWRHA